MPLTKVQPGREKNLPPRRTQKALLGAKMQKKHGKLNTFSQKSKHESKINSSNSDN